MNRFVYIVQPLTLKRANIYKIGQSMNPEKRLRQLGGSGSTETFSMIYSNVLPRGVSDIDILRHKNMNPYVIHQHRHLINKCCEIIGQEHLQGLIRRKELLHFDNMSRDSIISLLIHTISDIDFKF